MIDRIKTHPVTVEKILKMTNEYEEQRESLLNRARRKSLGSTVCGATAVGGGIVVAFARGKIEGMAVGAVAASEAVLAGGSIFMGTFGLIDKSEADDASRKAANLQGVLAYEERVAGELIGPGPEDRESEIVQSVINATIQPVERV